MRFPLDGELNFYSKNYDFYFYPKNPSNLPAAPRTPQPLTPGNPSSIYFLSLSLQPILTFSGKPLPASLFISQQVWVPQTPTWHPLQLVPRMERGPPHTSRVLPAPLIYIKKTKYPLALQRGSTHSILEYN